MTPEELDRFKMLMEQQPMIILNNPADAIEYETTDGKKFKHIELASIHQQMLDREAYYYHLMSRRNWLQRLFNIKPSMKFYDKHR